MQSPLTILFLFLSQISFGQIICDSTSSALKVGDYPPGCFICDDNLKGDNFGYTPDDTINYNFICGDIENSRWYTFATGVVNSVDISIPTTNCKNGEGLEMSIFDEDLNLVSNCVKLRVGNSVDLSFSLKEYSTYYLVIDGINGDECEFEILLDLNPNGSGPFFTQIPVSKRYCIGAEVCFDIEFYESGEKYHWNLPATDSIIIGGGINERRTCLYFKTEGYKKIVLEVESSSGISTYVKSFLVNPGQSISIDTLYSNRTRYCERDTFEFHFDWQHQADMEFEWEIPDIIEKVEGGGINDNFFKGIARYSNSTLDFRVTPIDECGFPYIESINTNIISATSLDAEICSEICYYIGDSCFNRTGRFLVNTGLRGADGCDSLVLLDLETISVFSSPLVECSLVNDGIWVEWEQLSGATNYVISVNRDSFATVEENFILLNNIQFEPITNVKIQPIGHCTYLPAEIECISPVSNLSNNFLNKQIYVFPNPTTGNLIVETDLQIEEILIFDATGRFLQKENTTAFELKNLKSGIYFLKIKTNEGVVVKRVLVN